MKNGKKLLLSNGSWIIGMKSKIGTFSIIDGIVSPEILSQYLDFLILDSEHGLESYSEQRIRYICSKKQNNEVFLRVDSLNRISIQKALEIKPDGIMIPQISSFQDAKNAINFSFFPPTGSRGISPYTRAFDYESIDVEIKKTNINQTLKLCLLIEGKNGILALPEIIESYSDYIYMIYFGLFDFCNSLGLKADLDNPEILKGIKKIIKICEKNNVYSGTIAINKNAISILKKIGINYIVYKNDSEILIDGINLFNDFS